MQGEDEVKGEDGCCASVLHIAHMKAQDWLIMARHGAINHRWLITLTSHFTNTMAPGPLHSYPWEPEGEKVTAWRRENRSSVSFSGLLYFSVCMTSHLLKEHVGFV